MTKGTPHPDAVAKTPHLQRLHEQWLFGSRPEAAGQRRPQRGQVGCCVPGAALAARRLDNTSDSRKPKNPSDMLHSVRKSLPVAS